MQLMDATVQDGRTRTFIPPAALVLIQSHVIPTLAELPELSVFLGSGQFEASVQQNRVQFLQLLQNQHGSDCSDPSV